MIRGSLIVGLLAAGVSALAHVGGLSALWRADRARIEGGTEVTVALLGDSFRDVAMGALTPEAAEKPLEMLAPVETPNVPPVEPTEPLATAEPIQQAPRQTLTALAPVAAATPLKPVVQPQLAALQPTPPAQVPAPQVLTALPEENAIAPQLSPRPSVRPKSVAEAAAKRAPKPRKAAKAKPQKTKKKTAKKTVQKAPKGTAKKAETRGSAQGQRQAKATAKAGKPGRKAKAAGNAAASNYPGIVMRKIQRRKPRTNIRGTAVVSFSIARSGSLAALSLAKSSGSAKLDKLALAAVRRAAPFPRPPAGARTRFTLPVRGR